MVRNGWQVNLFGFFKNLFASKSSRYESALEYYKKAANLYKIQKSWQEAADCYEECAQLEAQLNDGNARFATRHLTEAAHCYSFVDSKKSLEIQERLIKLYENENQLDNAGKTCEKIADISLEALEYQRAINYYKRAADYYEMESSNNKSTYYRVLAKAADLMCIRDVPSAIKECTLIYDKVGSYYLSVPLIKSSAKDFFFKAVICKLAFEVFS